MDILHGSPLRGPRLERARRLLAASGLDYDDGVEFTVLFEDDAGMPAATGSRQDNVLKCVAVSPERQGEGLAAAVLTELHKNAVAAGHAHLFLYTKPDKRPMFSELGFYPVVETPDVLFMENARDGVKKFVAACAAEAAGAAKEAPAGAPAGAIVANANPFTNGHLHLVTEASKQCALLHVFILSEDRSEFPAADRIQLVRESTRHLPNVSVHPTGDYLVSAATFPSYFIKDKASVSAANHELDLMIFADCFAPPLGIMKRFVGEEPFCPVTRGYNEAMLSFLPPRGVEVVVLPRFEAGGAPVSATRVRALLKEGALDQIRPLVPPPTYEYLCSRA